MPRVIVISDTTRIPPDATVLLDEQVSAIHLFSSHSAEQLIERLAWAVSDAEDAEYELLAFSGSRPQQLSDRRKAPSTERRRRQTAA
jgi:hypothetical protein